MQSNSNSIHKYMNIDPDHNESALVTSQFHPEQESPKISQHSISSRDPNSLRPNQSTKYSVEHCEDIDNLVENGRTGSAYTIVDNEYQLPEFTIIPPILRKIEQCATKNNFNCIFKTRQELILIRQIEVSLKQRVQKLICTDPNKSYTESRNCVVIVKADHIKEILSISAVSGCQEINKQLLIELSNAVKDTFTEEHDESGQLRLYKHDFDFHDLDQDIYQNPYYLDAAAVSMIYKYVKTSQIQKNIQNVLQPIIANLKSFNQQTHKKALEKEIINIGVYAQQLHEEIINMKNHNLTKTQNQPLFPYYRMALEKYLYEQVHDIVFPIYIQKLTKKEEKVQQKRQLILSKQNPLEIMKFLEIKDKFTCLSQYHKEVYSKNINDNDLQPPYNRAIDEINRINHMKSPREKLKCVQLMLCMMKSDAVEYTQNKEELTTMDDELPIIIYIVLMSKFINQYAEIQYVEDFSNTDLTIENERRALTNILVSLDYIANEWEVK